MKKIWGACSCTTRSYLFSPTLHFTHYISYASASTYILSVSSLSFIIFVSCTDIDRLRKWVMGQSTFDATSSIYRDLAISMMYRSPQWIARLAMFLFRGCELRLSTQYIRVKRVTSYFGLSHHRSNRNI